MNHHEGASPISSGTGGATSQLITEEPLTPEALGQVASGEVGERLGRAEGDDKGENRGSRESASPARRRWQHAPLEADHGADERVQSQQQGELAGIGADAEPYRRGHARAAGGRSGSRR